MSYHHLTPKQILAIARDNLTRTELDVWIAKHYQGYGRRAGSLMLGITEDAFRYRLRAADTKMRTAIHTQEEAA